MLLDDHPGLGGRARSDTVAGVTVDIGAQLVPSTYRRTMRLLRTPAPGNQRSSRPGGVAEPAPLIRAPGRDRFVSGGAAHILQTGSLRSLFSFGGLSPLDRLRVAAHLLPLLARWHADLDADATRLPQELDASSAFDFVAARIGTNAAGIVTELPVNAPYAFAGGEVSFAFLMVLARYLADSDVMSPAHGWSVALADSLDDVPHECGVRIASLRMDGSRGVAESADRRRWEADGVVVATDARAALALVAPVLPATSALAAELTALPMRETWTLALVLDGGLESDVFGVFAAAAEATMVSGCALRQGAMHGAVLAWPTPAAAARHAGAAAGDLAALMLPEVEALVPAVRGRVVHARVYRQAPGTPIPAPGLVARHARLGEALAALPGALALAGDYLTTPTIEGAVASGERAAARLATHLGLGDPPLDFEAAGASII